MPCLVQDALERLARLPGRCPGVMRSRNSTTVTSLPSRRHTEPSSSPITPAPTTSRRLGHGLRATARRWRRRSASSSMVTPGSGATSEPVAMMMCLGGERARRAVGAVSLRPCPGAVMRRFADDGFDLVLLEQEFDALGEFAHHLGLLRHHGGQIEFDLGLDAQLGEIASAASWKRSLACSSALEGCSRYSGRCRRSCRACRCRRKSGPAGPRGWRRCSRRGRRR